MRWVLPPSSTGRRRTGRVGAARRPPVLLTLVATATVALLAVPPVYLVIRAFERDAWAILARTTTWQTIGRTLLLVACVAVGALVVGASMAWLVARTDLPGGRIWGVVSVAPLALPSFVAALALAGATGQQGVVSQISREIGLGSLPPMQGLVGATLALTMATFPYVYLLTIAALRSVDHSQEEAARSLGRGQFGAFFSVTLPQMRRGLAGGALLAGLYAISDFGAVSLMRYETITRAIFGRIESGVDRRPAAVLGLVLVVLTVLFLAIEFVGRGPSRIRSGPGVRRQAPRIALGRWRLPALAWASAIACAFVLGPVAVMAYWLQRSVANGTLGTIRWDAVSTSLALAVVSAVLVTLLAVPVAILARRYRRPWTISLERAGYAANALPGVVVGLSLVFLAARYLPGIYQTFPLLLAAYLIRFFAEALSGVDTALVAISPRTEEAARSLGRTPLQVVREVTLPMMRPGLLASSILVFLSVIKELPATTLLIPTGSHTLATEVWRKTTIGAYGAAAVPALILIAVSIPFLVVAAREHASVRKEALPAATGA